jgi:hypothetical protein
MLKHHRRERKWEHSRPVVQHRLFTVRLAKCASCHVWPRFQETTWLMLCILATCVLHFVHRLDFLYQSVQMNLSPHICPLYVPVKHPFCYFFPIDIFLSNIPLNGTFSCYTIYYKLALFLFLDWSLPIHWDDIRYPACPVTKQNKGL